MRIHKKMILISLLLVLLLTGAAGMLMFNSKLQEAERTAAAQLQTLSDKLSLELEVIIQQNDVAALFMLSDPGFLSAISTISMPGRQAEVNRVIITDGMGKIKQMLRSYAVSKHFHSAILIGENGDFISSEYRAPTLSQEEVMERLQRQPWLEEARRLNGRMVLLSPQENVWPSHNPQPVFGTARAISMSPGRIYYLLIQRETGELMNLLAVPDFEATEVRVTSRAGTVLFQRLPQEPVADPLEVRSLENSYGLRVRLTGDRRVSTALIRGLALQFLLFWVAALLTSAAYLFFTIRRITRPLRLLQQAIENTALHNLLDAPLPRQADELQMLNDSFHRLFNRLSQSMKAQMRSQELEAQARMDALQAQVDPHFLYNTLTLVMHRAMQNKDDETMQICEDVSAMLRYSTSTAERTATLREELAHVQAYLSLMQKRYRDRLSYRIQLPEEMMHFRLPKIMLQPLVENAIRHAYRNTGGHMHIELLGRLEDAWLVLEVLDRGEGFDQALLSRLNERMQLIREGGAAAGDPGTGGGIGLMNSFERLFHYYGHRAEMSLINLQPGALVRLRLPLEGGEQADDPHPAGGG